MNLRLALETKSYMEKKTRAHIFVSGRVQGVYFRENTRKKAEQLDVSGWIKNLSDGRVEAVFEGEEDKIEKIVAWIKKGPIFAKIIDLKIEWQEYKGEFKGFDIRF